MLWPIITTLAGLIKHRSDPGLLITGIILTWACWGLNRLMLRYVNSYWIYNIVIASLFYLTYKYRIYLGEDMFFYIAYPLVGFLVWMIIFLLVGKFDYKRAYKEVQDGVHCSEWEYQDIKFLF